MQKPNLVGRNRMRKLKGWVKYYRSHPVILHLRNLISSNIENVTLITFSQYFQQILSGKLLLLISSNLNPLLKLLVCSLITNNNLPFKICYESILKVL